MGRRWIPLAGLLTLALAAPAAAAAPLDRPDDPVVVTGAGVPV
jgi:thiamine pyrophosphate-dependent acetolactate synthase large subunit-like protein